MCWCQTLVIISEYEIIECNHMCWCQTHRKSEVSVLHSDINHKHWLLWILCFYCYIPHSIHRGQAEREFRVEVEAIGHVRHKHLVRLLGYCVEGVHRYAFGHIMLWLCCHKLLGVSECHINYIFPNLNWTFFSMFCFYLMNVLSNYYSGCWCMNMWTMVT